MAASAKDTASIVLVHGPELSEREKRLLADFDTNIYDVSFTDPAEKESIKDDIIPRIGTAFFNQPSSLIALLLSGKGKSEKVAAGLVCDWYEETCDLELIYIAVRPDTRQSGAGTRILREGLAAITDYLEGLSGAEGSSNSVKHIYFETEHPLKVKADSVMPPYGRLDFFAKNGGAIIMEKHYMQPPLSKDKEWAANLMLCCLPVFRFNKSEPDSEGNFTIAEEVQSEIPLKDIESFLTAFYKGLGANDDVAVRHLQNMFAILKKGTNPKGMFLPYFLEPKFYRFPYATISAHYVAESSPNALSVEPDPIFNSYESDLMRYGLQDGGKRPIVTRHIKFIKEAAITFPDKYSYRSEGKEFHVTCPGIKPLKVSISLNETTHLNLRKLNDEAQKRKNKHRKSPESVFTLSISPVEGTGFTERDIIKLIALTGFGSKQENFRPEGNLTIKCAGTQYNSFVSLASGLSSCHLVSSSTGICDIDLLDMTGPGFTGWKDFTDDILSASPTESRLNKTVCGIILGIFDFKRMNSGEIADTVEPFLVRGNYFNQIWRGNLVQIKYNTSDERVDDILTSAYLTIPSAVLALNEALLKDVEDKMHEAAKAAKKNKFAELLDLSFSSSLKLTKSAGDIWQHLYTNYIGDIFQYRSEHELISHGIEQRGLQSGYERISEDIADMRSDAALEKEKYNGHIGILLNTLIAILTALQVSQIHSFCEISLFSRITIVLVLIVAVAIYFARKYLYKSR